MQLPSLVLKFGGTSVQDADAIRAAATIVSGVASRGALVVVSAASGVTTRLSELLEMARRGEETAGPLSELRERHRAILEDLQLTPSLVDHRIDELRDLLHGVALLREVTPRTWDLVLSYGEFLLAPIFAAHLTVSGIPARAWEAGELGMITDDRFTRARPLPVAYERIAANLRAAPDAMPVVTGFAGRTESGEATTLGRGGSDYSASIIAKAVGASELQIWTDVDGILTADPRVVSGAKLIDRLGFREASELAFSGAKVLHPQTITPAMEGRIPVRVLNTRRPDCAGTLILDDEDVDRDEARSAISSIAHKSKVHVVTIISPRMVARHGFISRIANVFDRHGVSIDMISTSEVSVSLTTDDDLASFPGLTEDLAKFSTVEVERCRGMVSIVGARIRRDCRLFSDVFRTVADTGTEIEMVSYGATRINLSFLIAADRVGTVVNALHRQYFE